MVQCPVRPEKWLGRGRECVACKAIRLSKERKEKEMAKNNKRRKEDAKVPSKANGWDWPEPQPKIGAKLNKVAAPPPNGRAGTGKRNALPWNDLSARKSKRPMYVYVRDRNDLLEYLVEYLNGIAAQFVEARIG